MSGVKENQGGVEEKGDEERDEEGGEGRPTKATSRARRKHPPLKKPTVRNSRAMSLYN